MSRVTKITATSRPLRSAKSVASVAVALAGLLVLLVGCSAATSGSPTSAGHTNASANAQSAGRSSSQTTATIPGPKSAASGSAAPSTTAPNFTVSPPFALAPTSQTPNLAVKQQRDGAAVCASLPTVAKRIIVSISLQHLWACAGTSLFLDTAVTTGASALTNVHDATPTGTMHVNGKVRNTVLAGRDVNGSWNDVVTYWMPFSGGDGFHDASWQTFPLGSPLYTTQGSHGCVHVALASLATLFDWTSVGTPVTIRS